MKIRVLWLLVCCLGTGQAYAYSADTSARLPIEVVTAPADAGMPMVLLITGDGGWKGFDPKLSRQFADNKVPVVALNALHYFWDKKTPDQATAAIASLLNGYMSQWHKRAFILAGYSFGADVIPFIANRLPATLMRHCLGLVLFSPGTSTDFEIHLSQMLSDRHQWKYDVIKEIKEMKPVSLLCFWGSDEHTFPVQALPKETAKVIYLPGGHHYDQHAGDIGALVLREFGFR